MNSCDLIMSLAVVGDRPTGLATYALNVAPNLALPSYTLLASQPAQKQILDLENSHISYFEIPPGMSAEYGKAGHFRRLLWTQTQIPKIAQELRAKLHFSPLPEAPLFAGCRSVVMVHDLIPLRFPNWRSPLTLYAQHYVPPVLKQALHIICNSQATADDIVRYYGISAQKITPIPLAHNAAHFQWLDLPVRGGLGRADLPCVRVRTIRFSSTF